MSGTFFSIKGIGGMENTTFSDKGIGGMEKIFENKELNVSVRTVGKDGKVLFHAKDVAESLGYADLKKAVKAHVWKKNRRTVGEIKKGGDSPPFLGGHPDTVLLYEPGLYQLICGSRLPIAEAFQGWVHPRPQAQARAALTVALGQAVEQLIVIGSFALKECCGWEGNAG